MFNSFSFICKYGRDVESYGQTNLVHSFYYTSEDFLKMLGFVIFNYMVLSYITSEFKFLTITRKQ